MELENETGLEAGYTVGMQPDGRELLVVVVKGTYTIPGDGGRPQLADEQVPLMEGDVFAGEPGYSSALYESDYAPHKPRCDVLLNGTAYAPQADPVTRLTVSLQVGSLSKSFDVVGNRTWRQNQDMTPEPFTAIPISYDNAFGGVDRSDEDPEKHGAFMANPVGVGFHTTQKAELIVGKPLPNTEESGNHIQDPHGSYRPMAFGPVGRSWPPRSQYAGTYDDDWLENVFPFLPADFDTAYYQSAPTDQQVDYLQGGENVVLRNLTPQGRLSFQIPKVIVPVAFSLKNGEMHHAQGAADTLVLEPDRHRFMITWRANLPLKKNIFEVEQVLVGKLSSARLRAMKLGKAYHRSLADLIREKRHEEEI
ncbi:MAG: DUF2169 domain-containing protein [Acidobacteriota bacterium]|nr:DUF2169 domain-containing protein [Acidobacteriota bacterium]